MRYIDDKEKMQSIDPTIETVFYDRSGKETKIENKSICKTVRTSLLGSPHLERKYFITTMNGILYDPYGVDSNKKNSMMFKVKEVKTNTFEYYLMYLRTRNNLYMTKAQRSFINA